eukprot:269091_1
MESSNANNISTNSKYEEIISSLPLQISLYFHWRYSIVYVIFFVIKYIVVKDNYNDLISIFIPIIVSLWSIVEASRIYLGYAGNLCEQVPHLFGFLFLTIFPQSVLIILLMVLQWNRTNYWAIDKALNIFQILFIISQLIFGYISIKNVIHAQTLKFKLKMSQRAKQKQQILLGNNNLNINPNDIIKQD